MSQRNYETGLSLCKDRADEGSSISLSSISWFKTAFYQIKHFKYIVYVFTGGDGQRDGSSPECPSVSYAKCRWSGVWCRLRIDQQANANSSFITDCADKSEAANRSRATITTTPWRGVARGLLSDFDRGRLTARLFTATQRASSLSVIGGTRRPATVIHSSLR